MGQEKSKMFLTVKYACYEWETKYSNTAPLFIEGKYIGKNKTKKTLHFLLQLRLVIVKILLMKCYAEICFKISWGRG